jgi:hypothetical protein
MFCNNTLVQSYWLLQTLQLIHMEILRTQISIWNSPVHTHMHTYEICLTLTLTGISKTLLDTGDYETELSGNRNTFELYNFYAKLLLDS